MVKNWGIMRGKAPEGARLWEKAPKGVRRSNFHRKDMLICKAKAQLTGENVVAIPADYRPRHITESATLTWVQFKNTFYEKYFTADALGRLKKEFMSLHQGDMYVAEFIRRFDRGCHFVPLIAREDSEKLRHFLDGLRPTTRRDVMLMRPTDYVAVTACAFQVEQALKDIDFDLQHKR
ncbi:uncharacterized protein LOC142519749 [Primulina tabacum]|uniref:uncharacterized protein LOC142519749 n=1 Tax=Primulina tabacum TaxID=48773 RepID=UPI003F590A83